MCRLEAPESTEVILKRFEHPDETREMPKGRCEIVRLGDLTIGRATYEPSWRWSEHAENAERSRMCPQLTASSLA